MGKIAKFLSGMLFNVMMGVVLASVVGVSEAYGAVAGVVIPLAAGQFMPLGSLCEGVFTEIWTGEMVKQLRVGMVAHWLEGIRDFSAKVEKNETLHMVDDGGLPEVLINNTTYPIGETKIEDGDIALSLDKFQTKKTVVTDDELYAMSYDKMGSLIERHGEALAIAQHQKAAHALAPNSQTDKTPLIATTGAKDADGRQKLTRKDVISLKRAMDKLGIPTAGRRLVLCPDHVNDLLEEDQKFRDQYYNYQNGKLMNMYGFEVHEFDNNPYYDKNGVKKALGTEIQATDHPGSFAFYTKRVFKADGSLNMYYKEAATNPDTQQSEVNFRKYGIVLPLKMEAIGGIYSWDGSSLQTKDASVTPVKNWAQTRKEKMYSPEAASAGDSTGELDPKV